MNKVLVIGSGGREHSICLHLSKSSNVKHIYVYPGNAGTQNENKCQNIYFPSFDFDEIVRWCSTNQIDLVVIGPEEPLIKGLANKLKENHIACFGPESFAAQLEGSKIFAKKVMEECNIATAQYACFSDVEIALQYLKTSDNRMRVIKADGIAAGKGVIVAKNLSEAETAVKEMLDKENPKFGFGNNSQILIEELLDGPEISVLAFTDGETVRCLPACQDHKRVFDGDEGPNTGGMGAFCPCDLVDSDTMRLVEKEILQNVIDHMRRLGHPYQGILYAGVMLTENGPFVLEFNCRFGDPETQVLLPQLKSDLYDVMMACTASGGLSKINVEFHNSRYALCVVMTSAGYPDSYETGVEITGLETKYENIQIIHAGTQLNKESNQILTNGGRVLGIVGISDQLNFSYNLAMATVSAIHFEGCHYRKDIGYRVLKKNIKKKFTYSGAGVNIAAGDQLVTRIKSISACTKRSGNVSDIGSFGAIFDLKSCGFQDPLLVSGTDGVGTKLKLAVALKKHNSIGKDLVAMCVNDILCHGAEPLYFLDYFATGKLDVEISSDIITGIANACQEAGCSLIGGETAEMPGLYSHDDYDLAGFAVGAVERHNLLPKLERIKPGDKIIGLMSNGLHSNGFSLVRKIVAKYSLMDRSPFDDNTTLGNSLLAPTMIYVKPVLQLLREDKYNSYVHSIAHITGGGLIENLPRSLPHNMKAVIDVSVWSVPKIFKWLWNKSSKDLVDFAKTFNLGIGMALIVSSEMSSGVCEYLKTLANVEPKIIGNVEFCQYQTDRKVVLNNLESSLDISNYNWLQTSQLKPKTRVAVLISGSGTNLEALLKYSNDNDDCSYEIVLVLSNVENVRGLEIAKMYGVKTEVVSHKSFKTRAEFDDVINGILISDRYSCQLICLAGFMRILGKEFTNKWFGKIINIHPSLLPSFKGAHAHREVIKSGVRVSGATVHFVVEHVDSGGIIAQEATNVLVDDNEDSLSERIKAEIEHKIYPKALNSVANGDCYLDAENRVIWINK